MTLRQAESLFKSSQSPKNENGEKIEHDVNYGVGYLIEWLDGLDPKGVDGIITDANGDWFEEMALQGKDIDFNNPGNPDSPVVSDTEPKKPPVDNPPPADKDCDLPKVPKVGAEPSPDRGAPSECGVEREKPGSDLNKHYNQHRGKVAKTIGKPISDHMRKDLSCNNGKFEYISGATGYDLKDLFNHLIKNDGYKLKGDYNNVIKAVIAAECSVNGMAGETIDINDYLEKT